MREYKVIIEKHPDCYVSYPLGIKGVVAGQGDTYEQALSDVKSAIKFHLEIFDVEALPKHGRTSDERHPYPTPANPNVARRFSWRQKTVVR